MPGSPDASCWVACVLPHAACWGEGGFTNGASLLSTAKSTCKRRGPTAPVWAAVAAAAAEGADGTTGSLRHCADTACTPLQAGQQSEGSSPMGPLKDLMPDGRQAHLARHVHALQSGDYLAALDALHQHFDTAGEPRSLHQQHLGQGQATEDAGARLVHAAEVPRCCIRRSAVQTSWLAFHCIPALSVLGCMLQCLACLVMRQCRAERCDCNLGRRASCAAGGGAISEPDSVGQDAVAARGQLQNALLSGGAMQAKLGHVQVQGPAYGTAASAFGRHLPAARRSWCPAQTQRSTIGAWAARAAGAIWSGSAC